MHEEHQYAVRAIRAGASGYLTKESAASQLVAAIRSWIRLWNDDPKPSVWHQTDDEIVENLAP